MREITLQLDDVIIFDMSKPQSPQEITRVGINDWLGGGENVQTDGTYVGLACESIPGGDGVAIIQRGDCAFTTKVGNAELAGYDAVVVFNHSSGCEATVAMSVEGGIPAVFAPRSAAFGILGLDSYDQASCDGSGTDGGDSILVGLEVSVADVSVKATFDGWGYFHVLNNLGAGTNVLAPPNIPGESLENRMITDIPYLGHMSYFAPIEVTDPTFARGAGDVTMHNVEQDPQTAGDTPTFDAGPRAFVSWYSAGMRAVEHRPGHWSLLPQQHNAGCGKRRTALLMLETAVQPALEILIAGQLLKHDQPGKELSC